jgi:Anti-sigma-K factor rskA, C-terminal
VRLSRNQDIELAELAALADGSLDPQRHATAVARVASSPELAELLAEQERAVALTHRAVAAVEAPAALRARIEAQRRPRRRRAALAGAIATTAAVAAAAVAVLESGTSRERFHAALRPTALLPDAGGEATLTQTSSGWRIQFEASGLPRLGGGRFYEAWLRDADGVQVPIGTFNEGRNVTLWAGVSPKTFKLLSITRESDDGNQASSGEKILAGTVTP